MQIGGLIRQSLVDWDGKIAAVIFTAGCNFRCFYCHNPALVLPSLAAGAQLFDEEFVMRFLAARSGFLDGVVITGGEPTIHADLADFMRKIKKLGYQIKLDTNGTNPKIVKKIIDENLADFVAMDIKTLPDVDFYRRITPTITSAQIDAILETAEILKTSGIGHVFRKTYFKGEDSDILSRLKADFAPLSMQEFRRSTKLLGDYPPSE